MLEGGAGDTVVARTVGQLAATRVRRVVEELRLSATTEDSTPFADVSTFAVAADGRILVADVQERRIVEFAPDGHLLRKIGRLGDGPGEFRTINGLLSLRDGRLAVADMTNGRVSFFTADGAFDGSWRVPVTDMMRDQLRTDSSGALYLISRLNASASETFGREGLLEIIGNGSVGDSLLPPDHRAAELQFEAQGPAGHLRTWAHYSPEALWQWHRDGHFVSANAARAEIVFARASRPLRIVREAPPISIATDEIAWDRERITTFLRRAQPAWTLQGSLPSTKPPLLRLVPTRDGRLWVEVATASEPIPEVERDPQLPGGLPVARWRSVPEYEVFSREGHFLGRVRFPVRSRVIDADGDVVWTLDRDNDGLPGIVRWRVSPKF